MAQTPKERFEESHKRRVAKWMAETRLSVNYAVAYEYIEKLFEADTPESKAKWEELLSGYYEAKDERIQAQLEEEEKLQKEEEKRQLMQASLAAYEKFRREVVPPKFQKASIDSLDSVTKVVAKKIIDDNRSCYIVGKVGTGKTYLIWVCAMEFMRVGEESTVIKADRMLSKIKGGFSETEDCYDYAERVFGDKIKHLFIDEISDVSMTDSDRKYLKYIIDYRYERNLQTCVFGNVKEGKQASEQVGDAVFSRLSGDGGFAFSMPGRDKRISA